MIIGAEDHEIFTGHDIMIIIHMFFKAVKELEGTDSTCYLEWIVKLLTKATVITLYSQRPPPTPFKCLWGDLFYS